MRVLRSMVAASMLAATGVAALSSAPAIAAANCSYTAYTPYKSGNTVLGSGRGQGSCSNVYLNIKRNRWGPLPDQVLSNVSRFGAGKLNASQACDWSDVWGIYDEVYGPQNSTVGSRIVNISC